eukprot:COSAG01_NODE_22672_length_846_cov_0.755020_2_plen_87_part_00
MDYEFRRLCFSNAILMQANKFLDGALLKHKFCSSGDTCAPDAAASCCLLLHADASHCVSVSCLGLAVLRAPSLYGNVDTSSASKRR